MCAHMLFLLVCWQMPPEEALEPMTQLETFHAVVASERDPEPVSKERVVIASFEETAIEETLEPEHEIEPEPASPAEAMHAPDTSEPEPTPEPAPEPEPEPEPDPVPSEREVVETQKTLDPEPEFEPAKSEASQPVIAATPTKKTPSIDVAKVDAAPEKSATDGNTAGSSSEETPGASNRQANAASPTTSSKHVGSIAKSRGQKRSADRANLKKMRGSYMRALVPEVNKSYYYPAIARRLGQEGRVLVAIRIDSRGEVVGVKLHRSSGHTILDKAAIDALRRLGKLPAPPAPLVRSGTLKIIVPMHYNLSVAS